jgi:hypothetical protein
VGKLKGAAGAENALHVLLQHLSATHILQLEGRVQGEGTTAYGADSPEVASKQFWSNFVFC